MSLPAYRAFCARVTTCDAVQRWIREVWSKASRQTSSYTHVRAAAAGPGLWATGDRSISRSHIPHAGAGHSGLPDGVGMKMPRLRSEHYASHNRYALPDFHILCARLHAASDRVARYPRARCVVEVRRRPPCCRSVRKRPAAPSTGAYLWENRDRRRSGTTVTCCRRRSQGERELE